MVRAGTYRGAVTGAAAETLAIALLAATLAAAILRPFGVAEALWDRLLPDAERPSRTSFHLLGLATVPALVAAATTTLWVGVSV